MTMQAITIQVEENIAQAYQAVPAEQRQKLDILLNLKLGEFLRPPRPLEAVITELSQKARKRGLTPEILESILRDE